jgi:hypothetical protein
MMTTHRVLLREHDFHHARIAILRELTGHVIEGGSAREPQSGAALNQSNGGAGPQRVGAVPVLSLAFTH